MRLGLSRGERATGMLLIALGASLMLARVHPFGDAELFAALRTDVVELPESIPAEARTVVAADCVDCHSSVARAPVYGRFAPVSWLLERDIVKARAHLNFSAWDSYDADKRQLLLAEIAQQAKAGHMPPAQYVLVHRGARLNAADVAALLAWVHAAEASEEGAGAGVKMAALGAPVVKQNSEAHFVTASAKPQAAEMLAGDAGRGEDLFSRRCTGCHTLTQNREGPRLGDVYGRVAASVAGFPYSEALKGAPMTWDEQRLNQWLTDPDAFVPGVNMDFRVPKAQERTDIIAFLKKSSGR